MNNELVSEIKTNFIAAFQQEPVMIFSPGRINMIGEHTDYNNGFVLPAAVDKGVYTAIQKSRNGKSSIEALNINESYDFSVQDVKPKEEGSWANYVLGVVAEIQKKGLLVQDFNLSFAGDIPIGAGMSSSAALENSVVFGLNELFDLGLTKKEMTLISQKAEHNFVGVQCGIMDQWASMFGLENNAILLDCKTLDSKLFEIQFNDIQIILINSNVKHSLADSGYNDRRLACEKVAKTIGVETLREATTQDLIEIKNQLSEHEFQVGQYIIEENARVLKATEAIDNKDLATLGKILYDAHYGMQHLIKISTEELDFLVEFAKQNQVLGARMMGGGFGGCTINLIHKDLIEPFKTNVSKAYKKEFNKECSIYTVNLVDGTHRLN